MQGGERASARAWTIFRPHRFKGLVHGWEPGCTVRRVLDAIEPSIGDLEPAYRQHFLRVDADQTILGMVFLMVPIIILSIVDYHFLGITSIFLALLAARLTVFGFCLLTIARLRSIGEHQAYDRLLGIWIVGSGSALVVINLVRPPTFTPPAVMYALVVLAVYLVMPSQLWHRLLLAGFFTGTTIILLATSQQGTDPLTASLISASVILTNAMGMIVATRLSTLRRREFLGWIELKRMRDELQIMATTDALTGVLNRRRFLELAEEELERAHRYDRPLAVIAVDLDHFKEVNDRLGHAAGDDVLAAFARMLHEQTRRQDIVGRLGGEEFAILVPETSRAAAVELADRIRAYLSSMSVTTCGETLTVTASLGVAEAISSDQSARSVLQRADQALYRAKHHGRNRVEAALPEASLGA